MEGVNPTQVSPGAADTAGHTRAGLLADKYKLRRYSKLGQVQRLLVRLDAKQMALGIASLKNLDGLLLG